MNHKLLRPLIPITLAFSLIAAFSANLTGPAQAQSAAAATATEAATVAPETGDEAVASAEEIADTFDLDTELNPAMSSPDRFAWEVFAAINTPANNGSEETLWETWATDADTFPAEPKPASCKSAKPEAINCPLWPGPEDKFRPEDRVASLQQTLARITTSNKATAIQSTGFITFEELVYRNRSSFDYIVENNLWYLEGIQEAVSNTVDIEFPVPAIEVKSDWEPFPDGCDGNRYHCAVDQKGQEWGLVAMHIMTKQTPEWTWATFEHVDNPGRCDYIGCRDLFGQEPGMVPANSLQSGLVYKAETLTPALLALFDKHGLGAQFQNYRLKGSQTNYTDPRGVPTLMGNSIAENGFITTASCMTCHARAAFNKKGEAMNFIKALPATSVTSPTVSAPTIQFVTNYGTPDPSWFYDEDGNATYVQMDFVWAMFNAKPIKK